MFTAKTVRDITAFLKTVYVPSIESFQAIEIRDYRYSSSSDSDSYSGYSSPSKELLSVLKKHLPYRSSFLTSGCYRAVLVTPDFVVKTDITSPIYGERLRAEMRFINAYRSDRSNWKKHFPRTQLIRASKFTVQLQEHIPHNDRLHDLFSEDVYNLGCFLGIDDVGENNYGWKGPRGKEYPVFFDVDLRISNPRPRSKPPTTRRSWMV